MIRGLILVTDASARLPRIPLSRTSANPAIPKPLNIESIIESFFVTPEGEGVLILPFAADIASDGCLPVQEVTDCAGGGCSTVNRQAGAIGRGANLLFYGLPVAFLLGLLLWRRKR